jgi:hypothetical protein
MRTSRRVIGGLVKMRALGIALGFLALPGVATEAAIVSALAPGRTAVTFTVGKSTCGKGATGKNGNATIPRSATAAMIKDVAIGRRMNGSDRFIGPTAPKEKAG